MRRFIKDPAAVLDYTMDWGLWLSAIADTIKTSTWVNMGLTKISDSSTTTVARIWLSGGVVGMRYTVTNRITTEGGRTEERSLVIVGEER